MQKKLRSNLIINISKTITLVCIVLIIYAIVTDRDHSVFGYRFFLVKTGSMQGTIDIGDLIITKAPVKDQLKPGDIISFVSSDPDIYGKINTHRIVDIKGEYFYTKGDASEETDHVPVRFEDIMGVMLYKSTPVGQVITWLEQPLNMFLFVILPTMIIIYFETGNRAGMLRRLYAGSKKNKFEKDYEKEILKTLLIREDEKEDDLGTRLSHLLQKPDESITADTVFALISKEMYIEKRIAQIVDVNGKR